VGILGSLLAMAAVGIGPGPHVKVGNDRHPLLIWPLLFGRTGTGRKGSATASAAVFFKAASDDYPGYLTSGLSSGEGLIERIRDGDGGAEDKRLLCIETEFGTVMTRAGREGSTLAEVCRQAWQGEPLSVLNRKQYRASSSHIGIIGHIAPKDFRRRLAAADLAAGTYNRYLPLFVERSRRLPIPEGADPADVADLGGRLMQSLQVAGTVNRLRLGSGAEKLWRGELYDEFTEADDDEAQWAEFMRRAAPYCLRIAGLYAALEGRDDISETHLAAAGALVRYSADSARYVLAGQLRDPRLDRLARAVAAAGEPGLARTAISGLFGHHVTKAELDHLVNDLVALGGYEAAYAQTGGRAAQVLRIAKEGPPPAQTRHTRHANREESR
jgi:hypothetical protein